MSVLHAYYAHLPSVNYIFPNGKPAIFVLGRYLTDVKWEIEHLDKEIADGHPHIYKKVGEETIDSNQLDPMHALRERILADAIAQGLVQVVDPNRDMGTSTQGKLNVSTSADIAAAAAGGSGLAPAGVTLTSLQALAAKHSNSPIVPATTTINPPEASVNVSTGVLTSSVNTEK